MKPEEYDRQMDDKATAMSERELEVISHAQDLLRKAMSKPKPAIDPIYSLNGTTIKVGYTTDWTGDTKYEVQIVGQLKDGRWLCSPIPTLEHNVYYEPYWSHTSMVGLFLRDEDDVTEIHDRVLGV